MAEITSNGTGGGLWSATGTWSGGVVPVNGDSVVVAAGDAVQVDSGCDHSGSSIVLVGITITSHATTPGRLYWKDDAVNGTGNIACSGDIVGTDAAALGQLVATADGTLADTDPLDYTYTALIAMSGTGSVDCTYLDVNMLSDEPTNLFVTPYANGTKQDFNAATAVSTANDTITINSHGLSNGDKIGFYAPSGATLPTPLRDDTFYYVRSADTNTFKVATLNSDTQIVDITAVGSGTCSIYEGIGTGSTTYDILQDVSSDNWAADDVVYLSDIDQGNADTQKLTISSIGSNTITLSAGPDGQQNPGARITLCNRNVRITHSSTSSPQSIIKNGANCVFGEISATHSSAACYGIRDGSGHTATTITGCDRGIYSGSGHTATTITGCTYGISNGAGHTATTITGCSYGIYYASGHTATTITGCNRGIYSGSHNRVSNLSGNTTDFDETYFVYATGGTIPAAPENGSENIDGEVSILFSENHAGVYDAHAIFQSFGIVKTVTAGTEDSEDPVPNQRSGGSATLLEIGTLQSNLSGTGGSGSADNKVIAWEPGSVRVWATSGVSKTYRFYINSTFAIGDAADFFLRATYFGSGADTEWDTIDSDETIADRDDGDGLDDWDSYVEVTVNPSRTGWVKFEIELRAYSAGGSVYIDPQMVIS